MTGVQALFPIGKTQWSKWTDEQKTAFNEARAAGVAFADAVQAANQTQTEHTHQRSFFDIIDDIANTASAVANVATSVVPVVAVATSVVKRTRTKKTA
jgi:hypothetical protein